MLPVNHDGLVARPHPASASASATIDSRPSPQSMKLVVYLPALNESATIGAVLDSIPRRLEGVAEICKIVIDDGSTDDTATVAACHGAKVVRHRTNLGTGKGFVSGVSAALAEGADIVASMDADGQFRGQDLATLLAPILDGSADVVLCSRFKDDNGLIGAMPWPKRVGNEVLTKAINAISSQHFTDVSCGFRAFTREAALRVEVYSDYEYIHESLLNWSRYGFRVREVSVPVLAERAVGQSRMMRSIVRYASRSGPVLIRAFRDYSPMKFFGGLSVLAFLLSTAIGTGVFVHWLRTGQTIPYTSFITVSVGGVLLALLLATVALLADLIARLRFQVEELLYESRRKRFDTPEREGKRQYR
jgi:glycosyltransferase involved in cell wall biosynthesis